MLRKLKTYQGTKYVCFSTYLALSSVFALPPLLFVTFREMYGISYTLLGTLVLVNFCTQLLVDLTFTFFTKYFPIHKTFRLMPLLTASGLMIYALVPSLFPQYAYAGLLTGTVIFSLASGLCEVLLSPMVAALPSDNPERDMSALHSLYGYGLIGVVLISAAFLRIFGKENWMYLTLFWALLPVISFILFSIVPLPKLNITHDPASSDSKGRTLGLALCAACIFLGSAAENTMTSWISGFMENALQLPKMVGDVLGMASYAALLALARTLYAKYGKNISVVLLYSMLGAAVCYLVAGLIVNTVVAMLACMVSGIFTSMLWPGTLILMEDRFPAPGVAAYALMAAAGDLGGSIAPQLMGIVVDEVAKSGPAAHLSDLQFLSVEQISMKAGMLVSALFPILGFFVVIIIRKTFFRPSVK